MLPLAQRPEGQWEHAQMAGRLGYRGGHCHRAGRRHGARAVPPGHRHGAVWCWSFPVVAGVVAGGLVAGLVSVAAGFLVYDYLFVRPYGTLTVGSSQDWVALGVYVVVMVLVAGVVASLDRRAMPRGPGRPTPVTCWTCPNCCWSTSRRLSSVKPSSTGRTTPSGLDGVALLLSAEGRLEVVASSGTPISPEELSRLQPEAAVAGGAQHRYLARRRPDPGPGLVRASRGPAGHAERAGRADRARSCCRSSANHLAIALERAQLRERILHAELLEEVDRLRHSLIGAVSHDLRTPLATIKVASSTFLDRSNDLSQDDADELHSLIDMQADRLTRLVNSLLDMTRIQSGDAGGPPPAVVGARHRQRGAGRAAIFAGSTVPSMSCSPTGSPTSTWTPS